MSNLAFSLLVLEVMLTLVLVVLYIYRARMEMDEEHTLILSDAEAHLVSDQAEINTRLNQLSAILKYLAIGWAVVGLALLIVLFGEEAGLL